MTPPPIPPIWQSRLDLFFIFAFVFAIILGIVVTIKQEKEFDELERKIRRQQRKEFWGDVGELFGGIAQALVDYVNTPRPERPSLPPPPPAPVKKKILREKKPRKPKGPKPPDKPKEPENLRDVIL